MSSSVFTTADPNAGGVAVDVEGNVAHDSPDAGNPVKVGGHANAAYRAAVGEDDRVDASYTLIGQARVAISEDPVVAGTNAWTQAAQAAGDASSRRVIKATPGKLRRLKVLNLNTTTALFIFVCNGTVVADVTFANLLEAPTAIPASGFAEIDWNTAPLVAAAGIVIGLSTSATAFTAPGAPTNALSSSAQFI